MRDPFGVYTSGRLSVVCQILHVEHMDRGTLVDVVTLEPCIRGRERFPAGTPLALGFGSDPGDGTRAKLDASLLLWESIGAVVDLQVEDVPGALRYRFSSGDQYLVLLVEGRPGIG